MLWKKKKKIICMMIITRYFAFKTVNIWHVFLCFKVERNTYTTKQSFVMFC